MKKEYIKPNLHLIEIDSVDIIATSYVDGWANGEQPGDLEED